MISFEELRGLLTDLESERVERTESAGNTNKLAQAVAAFANDLAGTGLPGYLIVGAKDNGELAGLQVSDQLLQNLGALRSDGNIVPLPLIAVSRFSLDGGEVAVVEVQPSDLPPVRYKGQVWIRVGPRRGIASEQEERVLTEKRVSHARTFDAQPCRDSGLADLALDLFRYGYLTEAVSTEVLRENHRDIAAQLASLRFFDLRNHCATNAGILLFGKNPLAWLPGAYVQFLRIDGRELADDVVLEKSLSGDLLTVLRELDLLTEVQLAQRPVPGSVLQERIESDYPAEAVRELLMNAVLHRSYESTAPVRYYWFQDRIEIQSPGGLYGEASPENFPHQTSYRNPVIAEAMKTLGFVNRFGRGVTRCQAALQKNGHRKADFHFEQNYVLAKIWGRA